ncbi:hypothetical protein JCM8547_005685 [Rhodosporidiobolus lusitaniae]
MQLFEPWLKRVYAPSVKPFYARPSHELADYLREEALGGRQELARTIRSGVGTGLVRAFESGHGQRICEWWKSLGEKEAEEFLLHIWGKAQHQANMLQVVFYRIEAHELTLDWAKDFMNLDRLFTSLRFELDDPDVFYRHVPHPDWDRLNDATSRAKTPVSRGVRAMCEGARIMRAYSLFLHSISSTHPSFTHLSSVRTTQLLPPPTAHALQLFRHQIPSWSMPG